MGRARKWATQKEYKAWYYRTKVKPYRVSKNPHIRYRCVVCGFLAWGQNFKNYLYPAEVLVNEGRNFYNFENVNKQVNYAQVEMHKETLAKKCLLFVKSVWNDDRIIEELGVEIPTIIEKIPSVDFSFMQSSEIKRNFNPSKNYVPLRVYVPKVVR